MATEFIRKYPFISTIIYYLIPIILILYIGKWDWIYKANREAKIEYYM